ncbi:MAG: T9SS type A sorting domain-containing protein [Ignavibacteria bacterium]|nr:T9SS type A sorting domain-containing protein [Ignavibacteria bacterium]
MKKIFSTYVASILFLIIAFLLFTDRSVAQQPGWIEQDLPQTMSGQRLPNRGDDVLIFTTQYSDVVYFFDIRINVWTEVNLGSQQTFEDALGSGNTVFAYSDEYIIAYSSILSQWDTVKYEGTVLDPTGISTRRGYGCGDKLAYFITNANIYYVFDSELAEWKEYDFGFVSNTSGFNNFWAADIYAGAIIQRNGYDYAKNITYSLVTHSFADLDQGGWYYYPDHIMHGGYVASWSDAATTSKFFGYCAATNEFKSITFPNNFSVYQFGSQLPYTSFEIVEDIFIFTVGYAVGDTQNRDVFVETYSTKTGNWYSYQYSFDPQDYGLPGWRAGGSFSLGIYASTGAPIYGLWKFYSTTNTYIGEIPDIFGNGLFICGGKVAVGTGDHNLWFHNFETGYTKHKYFAPNDDIYNLPQLGAENYCSVFRVNTTSDTMRVFFFNGNTDNLQSVETYKLPNSSATATPRVYGYVTGGPNNEVIFYSEQKDSLFIYQATEAYGGLSANNFLIAHTLSSSFTLFDASTCQIFEKNFPIGSSNAIGGSLVFVRSGNMELTAYSGITKNWTTQQTNQVINAMHVGDEIAVGASVNFAKYWAYSAYDDSYYELEPEGSIVSPFSMAGGKTAIVIRTTKVYAFSPGDVSPVIEDDNTRVNSYSLSQNYPNPFNPSTTIKWQQPETGNVTLKIYDLLGRELTTLINEELIAGKHETTFDASRFSSGIYFYQIKVKNYIKTKKMLLIK